MGVFYDIHGHGHSIQRAELGYLISGSRLDSDDIDPNISSIRNVARHINISFDELLRGADSFGSYLSLEGYEAVPGPQHPGPDGNSYFSGGENTRRHGSRDGGVIDAIQIESARSHRQMPEREFYVKALARSMRKFLEAHYPDWKVDNVFQTAAPASDCVLMNPLPALLITCLLLLAINYSRQNQPL